jgi:hypothetical protein
MDREDKPLNVRNSTYGRCANRRNRSAAAVDRRRSKGRMACRWKVDEPSCTYIRELLRYKLGRWCVILCVTLCSACPRKRVVETSPPPPLLCNDVTTCMEPVGDGKPCGDVVQHCTGELMHCVCATGFECENNACRRPLSTDPGCVPRECSSGPGALCGTMPTGCGGPDLQCGCAPGLTCKAGRCESFHRACDPVPPRDVCPKPAGIGGPCGNVSAGCEGAFVQCSCASGLRCVNDRCQVPAR